MKISLFVRFDWTNIYYLCSIIVKSRIDGRTGAGTVERPWDRRFESSPIRFIRCALVSKSFSIFESLAELNKARASCMRALSSNVLPQWLWFMAEEEQTGDRNAQYWGSESCLACNSRDWCGTVQTINKGVFASRFSPNALLLLARLRPLAWRTASVFYCIYRKKWRFLYLFALTEQIFSIFAAET